MPKPKGTKAERDASEIERLRKLVEHQADAIVKLEKDGTAHIVEQHGGRASGHRRTCQRCMWSRGIYPRCAGVCEGDRK